MDRVSLDQETVDQAVQLATADIAYVLFLNHEAAKLSKGLANGIVSRDYFEGFMKAAKMFTVLKAGSIEIDYSTIN